MTPPVESFHIFNEPVPSEEERRNEEEEEKEEGRTKGKVEGRSLHFSHDFKERNAITELLNAVNLAAELKRVHLIQSRSSIILGG